MIWLTNTLQSTLVVYYYPERWVDAGNAPGAQQVKRHAEERIRGLLDQIEAELARHGGQWLLGEHYTALDPYVFTLCRWTRDFEHTPPARDRQRLGRLLQRMLERPAVQRVLRNEGLTGPFV